MLSSIDRKILKQIADFSAKKKITLYIVGGYLRDYLLKREKENPDIDFCLKEGAINFARILSKKIKAGFVILDKEHGCCRLVKKIGVKTYTFDFADFRGKDLKDDLLRRDFTINSLAVELQKAVKAKSLNGLLIDFYAAAADLKSKLIRTAFKKSFDEDPLRILRAFSLSCIFGFRISEETRKLINLKKEKLSFVSYERIRDELFKILDSCNAFEYLCELDKLGILRTIMPEIEVMRKVKQGPYHHLDVFEHALESVMQLEGIIEEFKKNKRIQDYLNTAISAERSRRALIKLGVFLHDVGKPQVMRYREEKIIFHSHERAGADISKIIGKRLKLSNAELDVLQKMVFFHLRPGYMADNERLSTRAKFRYFRDTAEEALSVLLISLADQRSTRGELTSEEDRLRHEKTVLSLIKEYFEKQKEKKLPKLLNGNDLIGRFKLKPSPLIGKMLSEIEELQAEGRVKTKQDAFEAAERIKDKLLRK